MLSFAKRILAEYKTLVVKMHDDLHIVATTKTNLQYLCDIEVVMGLAYIMLLLESVHALIKFAHAYDTFVCDFVIAVKMCCVELYIMYLDFGKKYGAKKFKMLLDLHENNNDQLLPAWWTDSTTNIQFVVFYFMGKQYQLHKKCPLIGVFIQATHDDWTTFEVIKVHVHILPYI